MERASKIWHMPPSDQAGELQKKVSIVNQPECSICYNSYDNVFKTPKVLDCTHIFCLECLSRLMAVSHAEGTSNPLPLSCPFCRQSTQLSEAGPPALATSSDVLCKLPLHQQQAQSVWLDGQKLCSKSTTYSSTEAPDSPAALCICIDIGVSKSVDPVVEPEARTFGATSRFGDWRRVLLFVLLMVLLVVLVLWPLQCVFSTGNMRCTSRPKDPSTTPSTTTFYAVTESAALHQ